MRFVLAAFVAVLAVACTPHDVRLDPPNPAATAASPSPPPNPTTSPPSGALTLCRPVDLSGVFERWGAAAGSSVGEIVLAPVAGASCGLPANPAHRMVTTGSDRVLLGTSPPPPVPTALVPLVPPAGKASTFLTLQWSNHGAEQGWSCRQWVDVVGIEIQLGSSWLLLSLDGPPTAMCLDPADRISVLIIAPRS